MSFTTDSIAKRLFTTAISASMFVLCLPLMAMSTEITSSGDVLQTVGGQYGAHVNSMTNGATITTDLTNANVNIYGSGSTLTWQSLNTAQGQSLNFHFSAAGQVALNNVVGGSMSRFAGSLTSSGESGRTIISNPNGMLLENGSYFNVNALDLTTKNVNWDGNLNGKIDFMHNASTAGITIGQGDPSKMAVVRVAKDLNIVAPNISINAADIKTGVDANGNLLHNGKGDLRLITADGVTFYAPSTVIAGGDKFSVTGATNTADYGNITIQKASIAVADKSSGKVYLVAKKDINLQDGSKLKNAVVQAQGNINIRSSAIKNSTINSNAYIVASAQSHINNSSISAIGSFSGYNSVVENSQINVNRNIFLFDNSRMSNTTAKSGELIFLDNSIINNHSNIHSDINFTLVNNTSIDNSTISANQNIVLSSSGIHNSIINSGYVYAYHQSGISGSVLSLDNCLEMTDSSVNNSVMRIKERLSLNHSFVDRSSITVGNIVALGNGAAITNSSVFASNSFDIKASTISNSRLIAVKNIKVYDNSVLKQSNLHAGNSINITNVSVVGHANSLHSPNIKEYPRDYLQVILRSVLALFFKL